MQYKALSRSAAKSVFAAASYQGSISPASDLNEDEKSFRAAVLNFFSDCTDGDIPTSMDELFALKIYTHLLSLQQARLSLREAADDGLWRRLSVQVVPDVVLRRWPPDNNGNWKKDHFYHMPQRNWLKKLWWFSHLAWQGDYKSTKKLFEKLNFPDAVLNVVERTGRGYQPDVTRKLLARCAEIQDAVQQRTRYALIMHNLKSQSVLPELYKGGIERYVEDLFPQ